MFIIDWFRTSVSDYLAVIKLFTKSFKTDFIVMMLNDYVINQHHISRPNQVWIGIFGFIVQTLLFKLPLPFFLVSSY